MVGAPKNNVLVMRNVCNVTLNNMLHMWSKTVSKYDPEPSQNNDEHLNDVSRILNNDSRVPKQK